METCFRPINRSKQNSRARGQTRKSNKLTGNIPASYERAVVKREVQYVTTLTVPATTSTATGYVLWGGAASTTQEFHELQDLYAQVRLTGVEVDFAPQGFNASTGPSYVGVVGAVAHDPTSQASVIAGYSDLVMMPRSKLWSASGQGDMRWSRLNYRAPLNNSMNFGNSAETFGPGTWGSTLYFGNVSGTTWFSGQVQDAAVHATLNQEVLQVLVRFALEFRQPIADRGAYMSRTLQLTMLDSKSNLAFSQKMDVSHDYTALSLVRGPQDVRVVEQEEKTPGRHHSWSLSRAHCRPNGRLDWGHVQIYWSWMPLNTQSN